MKKGLPTLLGLTIASLSFCAGCQDYMANTLKKALVTNYVPQTLVGTEYEPVIRNKAYSMLEAAKGLDDYNKQKNTLTAITFLQDIHDPNATSISIQYFNQYPETGIEVLTRDHKRKERLEKLEQKANK